MAPPDSELRAADESFSNATVGWTCGVMLDQATRCFANRTERATIPPSISAPYFGYALTMKLASLDPSKAPAAVRSGLVARSEMAAGCVIWMRVEQPCASR